MITTKQYSDFSSLPPDVLDLLEVAGQKNFFVSPSWFANLHATVLAKEYDPAIIIAESDSPQMPVGALLLMRPSNSSSARTLHSMSNYYTSSYAPIVDPSFHDPAAVLKALASAAVAIIKRWQIIYLHPLNSQDALTEDLAASLRNAGAWADSYFAFGNWYCDVSKLTFQEYRKALPSKLRNTIERKSKQLERAHDCRIRLVQDAPQIAQAMADYEHIYQASWKVSEPHPHFIRGFVKLAAERGWLRFGLIYIDDVPAAAQIWIVQNGTASIYKLAYDNAYAKFSAGSILTMHLMEHVIDVDRVKTIDYLTGDDDYKKDWMSHRREFVGIVAYNPRTIGGLCTAVKHYGGSYVRKIRKILANPTPPGEDSAQPTA